MNPLAAQPQQTPPTLRTRGGAPAVLTARAEPILWLTGAALTACLAMIGLLLGLIAWNGWITFWPRPVMRVQTPDGARMGEVTRQERYRPVTEAETVTNRLVRRRLLRTGNYELSGTHFHWISDEEIVPDSETHPEWAIVVERLAWGRFYGTPTEFRVENRPVAAEPAAVWNAFERYHSEVRARWRARRALEKDDIGHVNAALERERLRLREIELRAGPQSAPYREAAAHYAEIEQNLQKEFQRIRAEIESLDRENARFTIVLTTAEGRAQTLPLADIVRAYPANRLSFRDRVRIYLARWVEFLTDEPREANSEGGVWPAIFGTVVMTLLMALVVAPFGVLAALYLREYARAGPMVSAVRIAINNLAGVPSIVFGVFGLGFFSYTVGARIDQLFYAAKLPNPTFGTGGVLWASMTLALLTLPVVIVATEEALAAVPSSMREGSYACGASKWQTIRRIVLPRAMPGVMTGMILAMARGAGEVAPLMLVGAVKLAPELPVDKSFPFIHLERSFMHLGFHIYDLGFQSQNSEASKPMVFTTTLLLIAIILLLNLAGVRIRQRLRQKFVGSVF